MRSFMEKVHKGEGGFTLIELLIVILILGAIATVVILNVGGFIGMGEKQGFCTEGDTIQAAAMAYAVAHSGNCTGCTVDQLQTDSLLARAPKYAEWAIATDTCLVTNTDQTPNEKCPGGYPSGCS